MLGELCGKGWTVVEPPEIEDDENTVARYNDEPIKSGFLMERIEDSETVFHAKYRSGQYDLEVKVDYEIGRGQVKVQEAEGYDEDEQ